MVGEVKEPIVVSSNEANLDLLKALGRYLVVIVTAFPAIAALVKSRDLLGLISYFESSPGAGVLAAAIAIGTILYGLFRTRFRAAQVVTVAADPAVPNNVAKLAK